MTDVKISEATNISSVQLKEQPSDPTTPASGQGRIYVKSDGGMYFINDSGVVVGPFGASSSGNVVQAITELSSAITATDTVINIKGLIGGVLPETFWVIVDPFTVQCEIRKVTGIATLALTVAAMTFGHAADDPVWYVVDPIVNVKWFGAKGDGVTDDSAAFQAALDSLTAIGGGIVYVPNGTYVIGSGLTVPSNVSFIGADRKRTILDIDTDDVVGIDLAIDTILRTMTVNYNNTAAPAILGLHGIRADAGAIHYVGDLDIYADCDNNQSTLVGISAKLEGISSMYNVVAADIDVRITTSQTVSIWGAILISASISSNKVSRVHNINVFINSFGAGGDAKGLRLQSAGLMRAFDCSGGVSGGTGGSAIGIDIEGSVELYDSQGWADCNGTTNANAIGINVYHYGRFILSNCFGYCFDSESNSDSAFWKDSGIFIHGSTPISTRGDIIGCIGLAQNSGSVNAYGMYFDDGSGGVSILGGSSSGEDYDLGLDTDDVYLSGHNYETIIFAGGAVTVPLFGDRDANHVQTITATTTLDLQYYTVIVDASGADVDVDLPAAADSEHKRYTIKRIDSSVNIVTVDPNGSETIDDQTTQVLAQYDALRIECDGSGWWIT